MTEAAPYAPEPLLAAIRAAGGPEMQEQFSGYKKVANDYGDSFVWLVAGRGEIQYFTDGDLVGQAWFLTWDRTHAVDYEEQIPFPEGMPYEAAGIWLLSEARKRDEATI